MASSSNSSHGLRLAIVGAGLSGLSAAISCALAGHQVVVLEAARELAEGKALMGKTLPCLRLLLTFSLFCL